MCRTPTPRLICLERSVKPIEALVPLPFFKIHADKQNTSPSGREYKLFFRLHYHNPRMARASSILVPSLFFCCSLHPVLKIDGG